MGLFRKGGGGFLNGVDAVITGYQFTDEFNGEAFKPGKNAKGKDKFHSLNVMLSTRVDGADKDQTTNLTAGGFDDYEVSEDGLTITPVRKGGQLGSDLPFGILITSAVVAAEAAGLDLEGRLTPYNFEGFIGTRVRFVQQDNLEATARFGKVKNKKDPKHPGYNRKDLVVDVVYELAAVAPKAAVKGGKPAKSANEANLHEQAAETLLVIAQAAGGSIKKAKLSMAALKALKGDPNTAAIRTLFANDEFLGSQDGLSFDEETQVVSVDA